MNVEQEIEQIKSRNVRVENDKAWELSLVRKLFITVSTYVIAGIWLVLIADTSPWLKALVPAVGYLLSTLSLPFVKNWWVENYRK